MQITFVLPCYGREPIGGFRVVYQYANGLVARGHSVSIVHGALLEPWQYRRPLHPKREVKIVARGVLDVLQRRPEGCSWETLDPRVQLTYTPTLSPEHVPDGDVVVATAWRTAESVMRYPASKGRKHYLIQSYEAWDAPAARVDATWRGALQKVVVSERLRDHARELGCEDVDCIPNAIDHDRFRILRPVEDRPPRVAMQWSTSPVKRGSDGVAALVSARRELEIQAVLFGVGPRPVGLPAWIEYVPNPTPARLVENVYNGSALYLCPSESEGWGLPAVEAMACGCALVSTEGGAAPDYAKHGSTALLSRAGDPNGLATNMLRLLGNREERVRLATAGNGLVRTFHWERSIRRFEDHLMSGRGVSA